MDVSPWIPVAVPGGLAGDLHTGVHLPLRVKSKAAALDALGGANAVASAALHPDDPLELSLRPGDPLHHRLAARRVAEPAPPKIEAKASRKRPRKPAAPAFPGYFLALRVRRPKRSGHDGLFQAFASQGAQIEVLGAVKPTFTFCGRDAPLADFQYVSKPLVATDGEKGEAKVHPLAEMPDTLEMVPQRFAGDTPQTYRVGGKGAAARPPTRKSQATEISYKDPVPEHPSQAQEDKRVAKDRLAVRRLLGVLMEHRRVWTKRALWRQMPTVSRYALRRLLKEVTFGYLDGPWEGCQVQYGYDPRKDPMARFSQTLRVRLPAEEVRDYRKVFRTARAAFRQPLPSSVTRATSDDQLIQETEILYTFDPPLLEMLRGDTARPCYMGVEIVPNFQVPLVDVTDKGFQHLLLATTWLESPRGPTGWWNAHDMQAFADYARGSIAQSFVMLKNLVEMAAVRKSPGGLEGASLASPEAVENGPSAVAVGPEGDATSEDKAKSFDATDLPPVEPAMSPFELLEKAKGIRRPKNLATIYGGISRGEGAEDTSSAVAQAGMGGAGSAAVVAAAAAAAAAAVAAVTAGAGRAAMHQEVPSPQEWGEVGAVAEAPALTGPGKLDFLQNLDNLEAFDVLGEEEEVDDLDDDEDDEDDDREDDDDLDDEDLDDEEDDEDLDDEDEDLDDDDNDEDLNEDGVDDADAEEQATEGAETPS